MRFYWPIAKLDAEQRMVWGYASTEALDDQGEIVKREALEAALGAYMRFANIREMHRPSAVGVAKEAAVDDRGLYIAAKIVDHEAWEKVVNGVYKGFSIGGRVTARDPAERSVITGLALTEISIVDRPANPEAVFDCWKASCTAGSGQSAAAANPSPRVRTHPDPGQDEREHDEAERTVRKRTADTVAAAAARHQGAGGAAAECRGEAAADLKTGGSAIDRAEYNDSTAGELAKLYSQGTGLAKMVAELAGVVARMAKQVEEIARTPLPPQTVAYAHGFTAVGKTEDAGRAGGTASDEQIVERFARLSPAEQTLLLIKAAYRNPMRPVGSGPADREAG
jgi:phage head maturation protease